MNESDDICSILERVCGKNVKIRRVETDGEKWFCAVDIAKALGYKNKRSESVMRFVTENESLRKLHYVPDGVPQEGNPDLVFVNRNGVLNIIAKSGSHAAKAAWKEIKSLVVSW